MILPSGSSRNTNHPPVVAIVQARMGSERFPNKMVADISGKPMLWWVINRLKKCELVDKIVVATPDQEISSLAYEYGAWGYLETGDPNNVLARYMNAANWSGAELVVRITGDCPLIDPILVDNCVKGFLDNRVDICTNVLRRSYPKGLDVEVVHKNVLKRIYHLTRDQRMLEHVTLFAYTNPHLFVFLNISQNNDYSYFNVSVDHKKDIDKIESLLSTYGSAISHSDIVDWFLSNGG
jgi:spore coat polysaccharide biosynthesis protein SpsF